MTKRECAVVMAYTGVTMLQGDDFGIFHKYCEDLIGHPIYTHEFPFYADTIRDLATDDFLKICREATE